MVSRSYLETARRANLFPEADTEVCLLVGTLTDLFSPHQPRINPLGFEEVVGDAVAMAAVRFDRARRYQKSSGETDTPDHFTGNPLIADLLRTVVLSENSFECGFHFAT